MKNISVSSFVAFCHHDSYQSRCANRFWNRQIITSRISFQKTRTCYMGIEHVETVSIASDPFKNSQVFELNPEHFMIKVFNKALSGNEHPEPLRVQ